MSWDGVAGGGGLTDDDVYAAMAAATAHSQAAAEVHRARRHHDAPSHVISKFCALDDLTRALALVPQGLALVPANNATGFKGVVRRAASKPHQRPAH